VTPFSRAARSSGGYASGHVGMAEQRVVVDRELRVERLHLAGRRDDQRVDLAQHRVLVDERGIQASGDRGDLLLLVGIVDAAAVDQRAGVPGLKTLEGVDVQLHQCVRRRRRDLLDVHPALRREHEQRLLRSPVERDREVVLLRDVGRLLDPELADDVAADVQPEDLLRPGLGLFRRGGELDPPGLPAAAGQHLRLHHDRASELLGRRPGLGCRGREPAVGHGNPGATEELLALVLVEVQAAGEPS